MLCSYVVSENSKHGEAKSYQNLISVPPICCHFVDYFFHFLPALDGISSSLGDLLDLIQSLTENVLRCLKKTGRRDKPLCALKDKLHLRRIEEQSTRN